MERKTLQCGLTVPTFARNNLDYAAATKIKEFAHRAEVLGFDALWVGEHLLTAPGLYGASWLSPLVLCPLDYDLRQLDLYASEILPYCR